MGPEERNSVSVMMCVCFWFVCFGLTDACDLVLTGRPANPEISVSERKMYCDLHVK